MYLFFSCFSCIIHIPQLGGKMTILNMPFTTSSPTEFNGSSALFLKSLRALHDWQVIADILFYFVLFSKGHICCFDFQNNAAVQLKQILSFMLRIKQRFSSWIPILYKGRTFYSEGSESHQTGVFIQYKRGLLFCKCSGESAGRETRRL